MRFRVAIVTLAVVVAAAVVVVVVAGGGGEGDARSASGSKPSKIAPLLRVAATGQMSNVDPARPDFNPYATNLALETLMKVGPDGSIKPHLAQSVTQPDPLTYVYRLRKGVEFWDGRELTAADAANALNYYRDPKSLAASYYPSSVKDITARGRYEVVVRLSHPDASWPYAVTTFASGIFEKRFADEHKGQLGKPGVLTMGTGPWKIDSLNPTRGIELSANHDYWGGRPQIERISIKAMADETAQALAFRSGEVDLVPFIVNPKAFAETAGAPVLSFPSANTGIFSMNTGVAPWNDLHVRRAVAYALNREDIIAAFAPGGYAEPLYTLIPPAILASLGSKSEVDKQLAAVPKYEHSLTQARREMAMSEYPDGFETSLLAWSGTRCV